MSQIAQNQLPMYSMSSEALSMYYIAQCVYCVLCVCVCVCVWGGGGGVGVYCGCVLCVWGGGCGWVNARVHLSE